MHFHLQHLQEQVNHLLPKKLKLILLLKFEDILQEPSSQIDKICHFLDSEPTEYIEKALHDARLPRILNANSEQEKKLIFIKDNCNDTLFQELLSLSSQYEANCYNIEG